MNSPIGTRHEAGVEPLMRTLRRWGFAGLVWRLAGVCALLVLLGSCEFRTARTWPAGNAAIDGAGEWGAFTFLCGLVAVGALLVAAFLERWIAWLIVAAATLAFTLAALIAGGVLTLLLLAIWGLDGWVDRRRHPPLRQRSPRPPSSGRCLPRPDDDVCHTHQGGTAQRRFGD